MKQSSLEQKYTTIVVSRKWLGVWWEFWSANRNGADEWEFYYQTRNHYVNKFGTGNVMLRLVYPSITYNH